MTLDELNALPEEQAAACFRDCCAAERWVEGMVAGRPYADAGALFARCRSLWPQLTEQDWLDAFEAHPQIGDIDSLRAKYANTRAMASGEQAGATGAPEAVLQRLKAGNDAYLDRFGFIFIVCASGKSAAEMLAMLEARLTNTRAEEIANAAREQARITELRLEKLL